MLSEITETSKIEENIFSSISRSCSRKRAKFDFILGDATKKSDFFDSVFFSKEKFQRADENLRLIVFL